MLEAPLAMGAFMQYGIGITLAVIFVDAKIWGSGVTRHESWDRIARLLRLSVAFPLIVGASFAGFDLIQTFCVPWWVLGLIELLMLWFMLVTFDVNRSLIANMNAFTREFAFITRRASAGLFRRRETLLDTAHPLWLA